MSLSATSPSSLAMQMPRSTGARTPDVPGVVTPQRPLASAIGNYTASLPVDQQCLLCAPVNAQHRQLVIDHFLASFLVLSSLHAGQRAIKHMAAAKKMSQRA